MLELRPAHEPTKTYGFACVVVCLKDLSASIWLWYREDNGAWAIRKVIDIPADLTSCRPSSRASGRCRR